MSSVFRFPIVLIALLSALHWAFDLKSHSGDDSLIAPGDEIVLRLQQTSPPLPDSAEPARQRQIGASIRAGDTQQSASSKATTEAEELHNFVQGRIRGMTALPPANDTLSSPETPAQPTPAVDRRSQPTHEQTHQIIDGDDLRKLAALYLDDSERYLEIFEANRQVLSRPDLLPLGASLRIPTDQNSSNGLATNHP